MVQACGSGRGGEGGQRNGGILSVGHGMVQVGNGWGSAERGREQLGSGLALRSGFGVHLPPT